MNKHDTHYVEANKRFGIEPIAVMEGIVCSGIPETFHEVAKRNLNIAQAQKYLIRCGEKDEPNKELDKALNYLYRARHGVWIDE